MMGRRTTRTSNESAITRLRDALVARARGHDSESGVALLSAIIFMIIMAGLSVVLLSTVLAQTVPSVAAQRNTKTIYAAQSGIQASLGMLRSAAAAPDATGKVYGALGQLKCSITGQVNGQSDGLGYKADITYYLDNPNTAASPRTVACSAGSGLAQQPNFAKIVSTGTAPPGAGSGTTVTGDRALSAVYAFKVSNVNIPGGRIFDGNNQFCLEAVPLASGSVGDGSFIKFVAASACTASALNDAKQLWIYDIDYKIKLASTTVVGATPLCITGPAAAGGATQDATLSACKTDGTRWNQLWSWSGSYTWQGQNTDITSGYSNNNLGGSAAAGNRLQVISNGTNGTFNPTSAVGAGAASINTTQIVNYLEFGRCLDVTDGNIASTFMISYPCKQDPSGTGIPPGTGKLAWNHKWFYNEPVAPSTSSAQTISVKVDNDSARAYCLQTPTVDSGLVYPVFTSCVAGSTLQTWTRIGDVETSYLSSYWFKDSLGRCLSVGKSTDLYKGWSKIVVATCDGSLAQKWNAPAARTDSTVGGYQEVYVP